MALTLLRRCVVALALAVVLAASLASEFPASAGGHMLADHGSASRVL